MGPGRFISATTLQPARQEQVLSAAGALGLIGSGEASLARLLALLCDSRTSANDVAATIEQHPVLCARVLRVANSAYYGKQRSITTIRRAVFVLGLDTIRGVAAAACVDRAAPRGTRQLLPDMPAFLLHTLATAVGAELLARYDSGPLGSEAFIAGVLHNLGVAVQACIDTPGVHAMVRKRDQDRTSGIRQLELAYTSVCHEDCAAIILSEWQLPPSLVAATGYHHEPLQAPEPHRKLASLVSLGASLALASGHTYSLEPAPIEHNAAAMGLLEITATELEQTRREVRQRVDALQCAIGGD